MKHMNVSAKVAKHLKIMFLTLSDQEVKELPKLLKEEFGINQMPAGFKAEAMAFTDKFIDVNV